MWWATALPAQLGLVEGAAYDRGRIKEGRGSQQ